MRETQEQGAMPDPDPTPDPTPDPAPTPAPDPQPDPTPAPDKLGDAGKAALDKEREARKAAEKAAKEAQKKLDAFEAANLTEAEKLKKEAETGRQLAATATEKLRRANLLGALHGAGVANPKAAARLLDGVQYDDDDEPTNLDDALKAAKAEYGESDVFKGAKPKAPNNNGGEGGEGEKAPPLTAEEAAYAKAFRMTPEEYAAYKDPGHKAPPPKK